MINPVSTISQYSAFISYRHVSKDRYWAIRIMELLETFRTPSPLQKQGFPARIPKLFRDEDEIPASSDLSDQIKDALAASEYLIVICSPNTSESKWVRREIELFQEMGKGDRILTLLVDGEPEDSYPPELRRRRVEVEQADGSSKIEWEETEPIAADVRPRTDEKNKHTEHRALLRIASALLGVRFDDLARRDEQRQKQHFRMVASIIALVLSVLLGGGYWYWDANYRIRTEYYSNYGKRWEVPFGVGLVSEEQQRQRYASYRFKIQAGQVIEMARVNGSGESRFENVTDYGAEVWTKDVAKWKYEYNADGSMNVVMKSRTGKHLRKISYEYSEDKSQAILKFSKSFGVAERQSATGSSLGTFSGQSNRRASIGQHRLIFNESGYTINRHFEPLGGGASTPDALGVYGRVYSYNEQGLVTITQNLDAQNNTLVEKNGVVALRRNYKRGSITSYEWLDRNRKPILNERLFAVVRIKRNDKGNIERVTYLDTENKLTLRKDSWIAQQRYRYDIQGNLKELSFYSADIKPVLNKQLGAARIRYGYDARGNAISEAYFDTHDKPVLRKQWGVARVRYDYDARGNVISAAYFGSHDKPVLRKDVGIARFRNQYDARGNRISEAYFDTHGKPVLHKKKGVARVQFHYDQEDNVVSRSYFDVGGNPISNKN